MPRWQEIRFFPPFISGNVSVIYVSGFSPAAWKVHSDLRMWVAEVISRVDSVFILLPISSNVNVAFSHVLFARVSKMTSSNGMPKSARYCFMSAAFPCKPFLSLLSMIEPSEANTSFRMRPCLYSQMTVPCDACASIPCGLAVRKQHKMLFAASKFGKTNTENQTVDWSQCAKS